MQTQRINISLPTETLRQLRSNIPLGKRSEFIAEAITEKLTKEKNTEEQLKKSLKANYDFYKQVAEDWKVTETEQWPD
jgi:metal-responsive CopG/Arc/MetJ family transcriptional regulator